MKHKGHKVIPGLNRDDFNIKTSLCTSYQLCELCVKTGEGSGEAEEGVKKNGRKTIYIDENDTYSD